MKCFFQLNLRLKSVLSELEELRDKKETSNLQLDQVIYIFFQSYPL